MKQTAWIPEDERDRVRKSLYEARYVLGGHSRTAIECQMRDTRLLRHARETLIETLAELGSHMPDDDRTNLTTVVKCLNTVLYSIGSDEPEGEPNPTPWEPDPRD